MTNQDKADILDLIQAMNLVTVDEQNPILHGETTDLEVIVGIAEVDIQKEVGVMIEKEVEVMTEKEVIDSLTDHQEVTLMIEKIGVMIEKEVGVMTEKEEDMTQKKEELLLLDTTMKIPGIHGERMMPNQETDQD
jgi:hypothetical protein